MSRRKLLLADDSITIQKVVNLTFADEGVDVVTVGDGNAALAELSSSTPDILLADVNMPGPTGYEICEQLRNSDATRNLPVILLVGSFEPFDEAEASRVGANAYLTKPFQSIKQLISQVNELIEAASPSPVEEARVEEPLAPESEAVAEASASEDLLPETQEAHSDDAGASNNEAASVETAAEVASDETESQAPRYFDDLGYETGAPPTEPKATAAGGEDEIDSLYAQSISAGDDGLSDVGIDDEMIETSYSTESANNDLAEFRSEVEADSGSYEGQQSSLEAPAETVPEQFEAAAPVSFTSGYEQRFPEDPSKFENTISYQNWKPADMRGEDERPPIAEAESSQSFETTRLDESSLPAGEEPSAAPTIGEDTIRMEGRFDTTGTAFKFDDVNLLDLSDSDEAPVEITSPVNAVEQGSSKQVVTLSPELIEMIAQRVVEKLSERY